MNCPTTKSAAIIRLEVEPVQLPAVVPPSPRTRSEIRADIRRSHEKAMVGVSYALIHSIETGEFLIEAKKAIPRGDYEDFVMLECGLKLSTAQMYVKLAKGKDKLFQLTTTNPQTSRGLSQAQALKFLSAGGERKPVKKKKDVSEPPNPRRKRFLGIW